MSDERSPLLAGDESVRPGESFLQRFNRRKLEARRVAEPPEMPAADAATTRDESVEPPPELTDADMPPVESLHADSDYTGFLSTKVSEGLRRAALRKLFHTGQFNVIDELDDYAEDFTTFTALGDLVTADMRHRLEVEARKQAEALRHALLDDDGAPAQDTATHHDGDARQDIDPSVDLASPAATQATPAVAIATDSNPEINQENLPPCPQRNIA